MSAIVTHGAPAEAFLRECGERGYASLELAVPAAVFAGLLDDVERLWRQPPPFVAYSFHGHWTRFSGEAASSPRPVSPSSCRLADLHAVSQFARALYLQPQVHAALAALTGEPVVATRSVYLEAARYEALHRSPAGWEVWIACEDVSAAAGALLVVPGSQRLAQADAPPDGLAAARPAWDAAPSILAGEGWLRQCEAAGLRVETVLPRRGSAIVLHPAVLRGSRHAGAERTRRALVVQFAPQASVARTERTYIDRLAAQVSGELEPRPRVYSTAALLRQGEARGFDSPLRDHCLWESPAVIRRASELGVLLGERTAERDRLAARVSWMRRSRFWRLREWWFACKRRWGWSDED